MKPQEAELVTEISKLQCMVSELKTGFTSALLELSQIQHGDSDLREEVEENRKSCKKKALRMEALVESLREELGVMQCQILQLYSNRQRPIQEGKGATSKQRESDPAESLCERRQCERSSVCLSRGKLLLHCFLQGLKAGMNESTDARHQVAMQLLHSEWEYVSTLNQLYDKYKTPPAHLKNAEPYQTYQKFVEQLLQRHLLFRNTLQERLSAEHWKSLVGDILVQLIGQNDTTFSDMYLGYTTTLASFLSLEFNRLNRSEKTQSGQMDREEMKLLSLLLAPLSRVHSYLSHIQSLLQWTGKDHPDCSLLLGTERALRSVLSRCHVVLEEDVRWDDGDAAGQSCSSDAAAGSSSTNCRDCHHEANAEAQRDDPHPAGLTNGVDACHSMRLECLSCSPVRRKGWGLGASMTLPNPRHQYNNHHRQQQQQQPSRDCGHAYCRSSLLTPDTSGWDRENSDSGQGTYSLPPGKNTNDDDDEEEEERRRAGPKCSHGNAHEDYGETDQEDTSAFDYSSVTSCSPDGTLRREMTGSNSPEEEEEEEEEEEDEEEDSQEPVLLKPSYGQQQHPRETPRERTVCLRWQIPRLTPHPPLRNPPAPPGADGMKPCLVNTSYGKRLVSVRKGSPPLHPKSAFRPIWDDPSKQVDSAPEKDSRQGFVPIQAAARQSFQNFNPSRENLRPGLPQQRAAHPPVGLWDDSEDSEGPCSTV